MEALRGNEVILWKLASVKNSWSWGKICIKTVSDWLIEGSASRFLGFRAKEGDCCEVEVTMM